MSEEIDKTNCIQVFVQDRQGKEHILEGPTDLGLNLMDLCKIHELPMAGTCGGVALCASCQCYVVSGHVLPPKGVEEENMLSEAFHVRQESRLACQIRLNSQIHGLRVIMAPEEEYGE
ncbi:MAG: 2Fe-2S iron-sulfur cluster-binding protein [Cytophagales bacterium]|nr:2Fe-2S iron-sulfur cluster-binding protein [Cytophagales bacterium]